ncbi:MAG: hypothetical protein KDC83_07560 [Flavobacteriales bacterium]|nr:hypothetical protein [Flavobacteriales bacterium]
MAGIKHLFTLFVYFVPLFLSGQAGTVSDPFTQLKHAWFASSDGIYYFDIGGNSFSTYVESGNGWILMASGDGSTTESSYSSTTALTLQSDKILPSSIFTSTLVTAIRMSASGGPNLPFDVESTDSGVLSNLQNNNTLSDGTNSGDWTGTGTARLARSCAGNSGPLSTHIYHACGNTGNMHWQVGKNTDHEKIVFSNATKNNLNLWIRATQTPLPIELLEFLCIPIRNNKFIQIAWKTASEINCEKFIVQRSKNGQNWESLDSVDGAGTSSTLNSYNLIDPHPLGETSYYRLKQIDFNGSVTFSQIESVHI